MRLNADLCLLCLTFFSLIGQAAGLQSYSEPLARLICADTSAACTASCREAICFVPVQFQHLADLSAVCRLMKHLTAETQRLYSDRWALDCCSKVHVQAGLPAEATF